VDLRGFGESDSPPGPYTMDLLASDLAGLLEQRTVQQVVLVGLSMGGYIAFAFWRRYAANVRALVLADTRAGPDNAEAREARETYARRTEQEGLSPLIEFQLPRLLSSAASPDLRQWVRDMIEEASPIGVAGALRGMAARPDSTDLLPGITCPVLVLGGTSDSLTPPDELRAMAERLPRATFTTLDVAGHLANLEQPDAFNAALRRFLDALPG
jgi:pimeloyl-ACP methyl ester carboxylesterase